MKPDHLRTAGLPQPHVEPDELLLHEAHTRVVTLVKLLKESGGISTSDAYDAPQYARLAHQNGEYDVLYNFLEHLGSHDPYVVESVVRVLRVDGAKNTGPVLTAEQMAAATSWRRVMLDRHHARIQWGPEDESPYYAYVMTRLTEVTEIVELMERGIREPSEIEPLLEQKRTVEKSLSGGVL